MDHFGRRNVLKFQIGQILWVNNERNRKKEKKIISKVFSLYFSINSEFTKTILSWGITESNTFFSKEIITRTWSKNRT